MLRAYFLSANRKIIAFRVLLCVFFCNTSSYQLALDSTRCGRGIPYDDAAAVDLTRFKILNERVYESPSCVATRFKGKLHESKSFSAPLSSPESHTSSPLPLPSLWTGNWDARRNC